MSMSIINTAYYARNAIYRDTDNLPKEIIGDTGFVLRLRREMSTAHPNVYDFLLGMRIYESPLVPAGHFMLNGQLVRYIKLTLDEVCAEARKRLAAWLDADVECAHYWVAEGFKSARMVLGVEK